MCAPKAVPSRATRHSVAPRAAGGGPVRTKCNSTGCSTIQPNHNTGEQNAKTHSSIGNRIVSVTVPHTPHRTRANTGTRTTPPLAARPRARPTSCVCVARRHRPGSREQAHATTVRSRTSAAHHMAGRPTRRAKRRADRPQACLPEAGLAEAGLAEVGLLLHLQEGLEGRARAHEVAVAVGVVDARGGRPELVLLEAGLRLGLGLGLG